MSQLLLSQFDETADGVYDYGVRNSRESRKEQKKIAQRLHKSLNASGTKAQRKGGTNECGDETIQLNNGWWLLIREEDGWEFLLGKDRTGCSYDVFYDSEAQAFAEIPEIVGGSR